MFAKRSLIATLYFSLLFTCATADEQMFRCVLADGSLSFQKTRCAGEGDAISVGAVQGGWTSLRPGEKTLLQHYRERDARRRTVRKSQRKPKVKPVETAACWKKRKRLDALKTRLRRGYKPSEGEGLRRKRTEYSEYLEKFCP